VERVVPRPPRFRSQASRPCGRGTSQRFQHTRALRPCFMPRPSLGFALQSLPLADSRDPSRGPVAPLRSSTDVPASVLPRAPSPPVSPTPTPSPEGARGGLDPRTTISELSAGTVVVSPRFPPARGAHERRQPYRQLHPLRSLDPPASPFASTPTGLPRIRPRVAPKPPRNGPLRDRPIVIAGRCSPGLRPSRDILEPRALTDLPRSSRTDARTLVPCATGPHPHGDPRVSDPIG
jgi:hypothetical protein